MLLRIAAAVRRRVRAWRALRQARTTTAARLAGATPRRVLVVCYGNIYRSAFVGEYLRARAGNALEIRSSGFHDRVGRPSPERHVNMSRELSVDLSGHRSALTTRADLEWADTIVLMDRHNWNRLDEMGVDHSRLVWLGALGGSRLEIPDPYLLDDAGARRVLTEMQSACEALLARVLR